MGKRAGWVHSEKSDGAKREQDCSSSDVTEGFPPHYLSFSLHKVGADNENHLLDTELPPESNRE